MFFSTYLRYFYHFLELYALFFSLILFNIYWFSSWIFIRKRFLEGSFNVFFFCFFNSFIGLSNDFFFSLLFMLFSLFSNIWFYFWIYISLSSFKAIFLGFFSRKENFSGLSLPTDPLIFLSFWEWILHDLLRYLSKHNLLFVGMALNIEFSVLYYRVNRRH